MRHTALFFALVAAGCGSTGVIADGGTDSNAQSDAGGDASDAQVGPAIFGLTPGTWTWVDFPDAKCRDGSPTGIGVSPSATGSTKLMIFLEGGGACFNGPTCGTNPAHFDQNSFNGQFVSGESKSGIFVRADPQNAVADWNMVYVPYCTGDVHAGNAPNAQVPGVSGVQQFVGYLNVGLYLQRLVPTFPSLTRILLTGQSAGGFGAALEYVQVSRAFANVPVDLLDDAGPLMGNPYLAPCLEQALSTLFGLTSTFIAKDCGSDCSDPGNNLLLYWKHLPATYPNARFGFIDSTADSVISSFFGFGANSCAGFAPLTAAQYEAGLLDMRAQVQSNANVGSFIYQGSSHTSLVAAYTTRTSTGGDGGVVRFEDWVGQLVANGVTNVGP